MSQFGEEFINTELNTEGVKKGAQEINSTMDETAKNVSSAAQEMGDSISNAVEGATQKSLGTLRDFVNGFKEGFSEIVNTAGAVDLTQPNNGMENAVEQTQTFRDRIVSALDEISMKFYQSGTRNGELMGNTINQVAALVENSGGIVNRVLVGIGGATVTAVKGIGKLAIGLGKAAINGAKLVGSGIISGLKKIGTAALQGAKNFLGLGRASQTANSGFKGGLKSLLKYGLGISSLFILFNKLRSAITDGMKNLARYDKETNASISSVSSALATLKNALATAFAPILNVVAPIITSFINKLTQLATAIGMVIAKLTGKGTFTKAVAVQKDYAKSLDKSGKSAKNATLSIDELNQSVDDSQSGGGDAGAGEMFEEVPIDEQSSDFADKLKAMWENADFTDLGTIIGGKLAQALDSIDWGGIQAIAGKIGKGIATLINGFVEFPDLGFKIGNAIAQAFNTALAFVYEFVKNLHWDSVGKFIGDGINGIFLNIDWAKLYDTIALSLNGISETILNTLKTIDFSGVGTAMSTGLQDAFVNLDVGVWTEALGETIKGGFDFATAFLNNIDWQSLPSQIKDKFVDAFTSVDWSGIAKSIATFLGTAIASNFEYIVGIGEVVLDIVKSIKDYFKQYIDEYIATTGEDNLGKAIIMGVLNGIIDGIKNIGQWIYDNIFTPFIEGFKSAFEIHSPSHVMQEMGGYILDGLFNGLKGLWDKVKNIFVTFKSNVQTKVNEIKKNVQDKFTEMRTNVQTTVKNLKTKVVSIFEELKTAVKTPINAILGLIEGFCNGIIKGINKAINALNGLKIDVPDWVTDLTGVSSFGFSIPTLAEVSLPRLATGTVVPRQASEFAAILGDNNQETEVVSPLSTIREAVADVMQEYLAEIAENTRELADKDFSVSIGDREIARANRRGEKLLGYQLTH